MQKQGYGCRNELECRGSVQKLELNKVAQEIHFAAFAGYSGQEQINLRIAPETKAGRNSLRFLVSGTQNGQDNLWLRLGAPNELQANH